MNSDENENDANGNKLNNNKIATINLLSMRQK